MAQKVVRLLIGNGITPLNIDGKNNDEIIKENAGHLTNLGKKISHNREMISSTNKLFEKIDETVKKNSITITLNTKNLSEKHAKLTKKRQFRLNAIEEEKDIEKIISDAIVRHVNPRERA